MTTPRDLSLSDAPLGGAPTTSVAAPLGARQSQKEATRNRVIEAAKELFDTQGYQGTTIREIAAHAGVSVGSVFTTFASKYEVLSQVMQERLDGLYAELDRVMPHLRGSTIDRLQTMFAIFFAFETRHKRLFLAYIAAAFDWSLPDTVVPVGRNRRLRGMMAECLAKGVEDGDVRPGLEVEEVLDLLIGAYVWVYRLAASHDAGAPEMTKVMDRQIALIAGGLGPR